MFWNKKKVIEEQTKETCPKLFEHVVEKLNGSYVVVPKSRNGDPIYISDSLYDLYIVAKVLNKETNDLRKELCPDKTIFAVQGNYPNIHVSEYKFVEEDKYNYCLRQKEGNISILSKEVCFENKVDALEYQNKLIQNQK